MAHPSQTKQKEAITFHKLGKKDMDLCRALLPETQKDPDDFIGYLHRKVFASAGTAYKYPREVKPAEVKFAVRQCMEYDLDPFKNEIHFIFRQNHKLKDITMLTVVGIEGVRLIAIRTGLHAGTGAPQYTYKDDGKPDACTIEVLKINPMNGREVPTGMTVFYDEFYDPFGPVWQDKPRYMLAKVAEAHALKKSFKMGQIYIPEELPVERAKIEVDSKTVTDEIDAIKASYEDAK